MRALNHSPHPVDHGDFYRGELIVVGGRDFALEEDLSDEDLTDMPEPPKSLYSNLLRIRRSVSEKLFSFDLKDLQL